MSNLPETMNPDVAHKLLKVGEAFRIPGPFFSYGQVSINISKPGVTKGQHWHNSKWEQFIVVHGHGLIQERNINTGETVEFEVFGDKIEAV